MTNQKDDKMNNLKSLPEWQELEQHQLMLADTHMRHWFSTDPERFSRFSLKESELFFDYSRNRITTETIDKLIRLAHACGLREKISALFAGNPLNFTEKRAVLHTALRDLRRRPIMVKGKNIADLIAETTSHMRELVHSIHTQAWCGVTGKPIAHIVNIGIGGSHLGPMMATDALKDFSLKPLTFHFISSVDKTAINELFQTIDPAAALFVISSKTFTTIETLTNARTIVRWMQEKLGPSVLHKHFIAVTAAPTKALAFGIPVEHILPMWEWVGGRYSIWSAIGLPLLLLLGPEQYDDFLAGGFSMDRHFAEADFTQNMPILLALIGIWYINFFGARTQAIIPYAHRLRYFIPYLQQAEMESNGKSINANGDRIDYATGSIIFGQEGCDGQHAYHQLLLQGTHLVPVDFILVGKAYGAQDEHQDILVASGLSQAQALMRGKTQMEAYTELLANQYSSDNAAQLAPHRVIPGNCPSNILFMERLTPKNLGALIALYEHKIFVQGVIWQINSFDQWGVELGKQLLPNILAQVQSKTNQEHQDAATMGLIQHFRSLRR